MHNSDNEPKTYPEGDFSFISNNSLFKNKLSNMYKAITLLKLWSFMETIPTPQTESMYWVHPSICSIEDHPLVQNDKHMNHSFEMCIGAMRTIKGVGWKTYVKEYLDLMNCILEEPKGKEEEKMLTELEMFDRAFDEIIHVSI